MEGDPTSALEQFRQEWRQEVSARSRKSTSRTQASEGSWSSLRQDRLKVERPVHKPPSRHPLADIRDEEDQNAQRSSQTEVIQKLEGLRVRDVDEDDFSNPSRTEPQSALEHFERAVEKESQGNLGDSLSYYRKAYRMDAKVDQSYKDKHFSHRWKQSKSDPSNASPTVPSTAHHSLTGQPHEAPAEPLTLPQLMETFIDLDIPNADPVIEGDVLPPCPIRKLPNEVLLELLRHIALQDISVFARLALVCKKLAYHIFTESGIWKRVALGPEFGLASQCYHFDTDIQGRPVIYQALDDDNDEDEAPLPPVTDGSFPKDPDWREVFHSYPRIRFTGVYISTVNYTRSGGASVSPSTWGHQVHIVTYYRYLRFFRDGTVISLLTTHEPMEVVHHLIKENIAMVRSGKDPAHLLNFTSGSTAGLPTPKPGETLPPTAQNVMKHALRGRWRLCHPSLSSIEIGSNAGTAGDLHIETEGAGPRYLYTMHLALKSGSRNKNATRNNKLLWKGFWSYNQLSHDWAEFQLRNDKAFYFSRVRSYGLGY